MMRIQVYYPEDPAKFMENLQREWKEYHKEIIPCNITKKKSIYHVCHATVFIEKARKGSKVNIIADGSSIPGEVEAAKSLLEKITEVKLME